MSPNLPRPIPNLDSLPLPEALKTAVRRIYQLLYDLRDSMLANFAALPIPLNTVEAVLRLTPFTDGTAYVTVPQGGRIVGWTIISDDATSTATINIWRVADGPTLPVVANTIMAAGLELTTGSAIHSTDLRNFLNTTIADHDILAIVLSTFAGAATKIWFQLEIEP